jgi:hypothetical protein
LPGTRYRTLRVFCKEGKKEKEGLLKEKEETSRDEVG